MKTKKLVLPIIIFSQFCCTSLWFAGNGVIEEIVRNFDLPTSALGHITSAVQFGFIIGTLVFAVLSIADRFSPSKVFLVSALFGALANLTLIWDDNSLISILIFRFLTGFFLAGIYPVGMKIAADYYEQGLGKSLSYLVAALVLGTGFPHLLKDIISTLPWKYVLIGTSLIASIGGLLMFLLVPDGPFRKSGQKLKTFAFLKIFKNKNLKSAAIGYFGHMWELYAFWAFVPVILKTYQSNQQALDFNIPLLSFLVIAVGALGCIIGGNMSNKFGDKRLSIIALSLSILCCLASPFILEVESWNLFLAFLLFWGMVVIADSPLLSTLVARNSASELKGTALTIVNSIGFFITIISIQLLTYLNEMTHSNTIYLVLAIGPILGIMALVRKSEISNSKSEKN